MWLKVISEISGKGAPWIWSHNILFLWFQTNKNKPPLTPPSDCCIAAWCCHKILLSNLVRLWCLNSDRRDNWIWISEYQNSINTWNRNNSKLIYSKNFGWKFSHIISYHIISYHIISYHIISYHIISYHIISYLII